MVTLMQIKLKNTSGRDSVEAGGGNDELDGGAGADRLEGGTGNDTIKGGDDGVKYKTDENGNPVIENGSQVPLEVWAGVIEQFLKERKLIILLSNLMGHLLFKILMRVTVMKALTLYLESKLLNLQIPTNY